MTKAEILLRKVMAEHPHGVVRDDEGVPLCLNDLPPIGFKGRWSQSIRSRLVCAVLGGLLSRDDVSQRYQMSPAELDEWVRKHRSGRLQRKNRHRSRGSL